MISWVEVIFSCIESILSRKEIHKGISVIKEAMNAMINKSFEICHVEDDIRM